MERRRETGLDSHGLVEIQETVGEKMLLLLEQSVSEQKKVISGTGDAHPHVVFPEAAGSGRCSRASPLADANQLGCWMLPAGKVCADAPAPVAGLMVLLSPPAPHNLVT